MFYIWIRDTETDASTDTDADIDKDTEKNKDAETDKDTLVCMQSFISFNYFKPTWGLLKLSVRALDSLKAYTFN